jgi:enediyne polyketide synthase
VRVAVERDGGDRRTASDRAIGRAAGVRTPVQRRPDGRPELIGMSVSAAHSGELTLGVAGALGCDLERVTPRAASLWRDLLGPGGFRVAEEVAREAGEELDAAATRVWSARESLTKAGIPHDAPLVIASAAEDGWVVLSSGALAIPTCVLRLRGGEEVCAAVLVEDAEPAARPELAFQAAGG